jgi:hypothetical protein
MSRSMRLHGRIYLRTYVSVVLDDGALVVLGTDLFGGFPRTIFTTDVDLLFAAEAAFFHGVFLRLYHRKSNY